MKSQNIDQLKEETNERLKGSGYSLKCDGMVWTISRQPVVLNLSEATSGAFAANRDAVEVVLGAIETERTALDAFERGDTEPAPAPSDEMAANLAAAQSQLQTQLDSITALTTERAEMLGMIDQQREQLSALRVELSDAQNQVQGLHAQLMAKDGITNEEEKKEEKPNA